jgi:hypothetical protein
MSDAAIKNHINMKTLYPEEVACLAMFAIVFLATSLSLTYSGFRLASMLFG